ncbi:LLM class oxidoreductase [uncultured Arcticibacterium sp.]|uniref:LLM class oxidoreductase n=1 Tax=uncultured Arcticibacterium sp. TaxID=2173042 RepID=UPI0030FB8208
MKTFENINSGFNSVFQFGKLSLGVVIPIENYAQSSIPSMKEHLQRVQLIEKLGFKALWVRDVPFQVPSFGDAGQLFDPFTYLGFLVGQTSKIALGTSSIALPLHHPVHVAKSAATIDQLSDGRLILGVASGDRPSEYPAMGISFESRGEMFKESFQYIRKLQESFPIIKSEYFGNTMGDIDVLPKATGHKIPMLITGYSQQSLQWNAENGDGWMNYPRSLEEQKHSIAQWRDLVNQSHEYSKPFMQPLYIDLHENDDFKPQGIHLGFRIGSFHLLEYLKLLENMGVNHVALNLRFNSLGTEKTLNLLAEKVLPSFNK